MVNHLYTSNISNPLINGSSVEFSSVNLYRYGFNGMEKDDEVKGSGNSLDFGARLYDPRIGRWTAVDPLAAKYPDLSPYNGMGNNPVMFIDADGREIFIAFEATKDDGTTEIRRVQYLEGKLYNDSGTEVFTSDINNEFVSQTTEALRSLDGSHSIKTEFDKLATTKERDVTINFKANSAMAITQPGYKMQTVDYDPSVALKEKNGDGVIPGYIVLGHELSHVYGALFDADNYILRHRDKYDGPGTSPNDPNYKYSNGEEKHNIIGGGWEDMLTRENNKSYKRDSHKTSAGEVEQIETDGPFSYEEKTP